MMRTALAGEADMRCSSLIELISSSEPPGANWVENMCR